MDTLADQCDQILHPVSAPRVRTIRMAAVYGASKRPARMANHILAAARFGKDQNDSVLDPSCRAWQFDNLYVTDARACHLGRRESNLTIHGQLVRVADILKGRPDSMHQQFDQLFTSPKTAVFQKSSSPDRIYHAPYLNATRSERYATTCASPHVRWHHRPEG